MVSPGKPASALFAPEMVGGNPEKLNIPLGPGTPRLAGVVEEKQCVYRPLTTHSLIITTSLDSSGLRRNLR